MLSGIVTQSNGIPNDLAVKREISVETLTGKNKSNKTNKSTVEIWENSPVFPFLKVNKNSTLV